MKSNFKNSLPQINSRTLDSSLNGFSAFITEHSGNKQTILPQLPNQITSRNKIAKRSSIFNTWQNIEHAEREELTGYKIKSLIRVLNRNNADNYLDIAKGDTSGLYTGELDIYTDELQESDRKNISSSIKLYLHKRSPLNAAKSHKDIFKDIPIQKNKIEKQAIIKKKENETVLQLIESHSKKTLSDAKVLNQKNSILLQ